MCLREIDPVRIDGGMPSGLLGDSIRRDLGYDSCAPTPCATTAPGLATTQPRTGSVMTESKSTKKLSGIPPGRCIHPQPGDDLCRPLQDIAVRVGLSNRSERLSSGAFPARLASRINVLALRLSGIVSRLEFLDGQIVIVEDVLPEPGDLAVLWFHGVERPTVKVLSREVRGFPHNPQRCCMWHLCGTAQPAKKLLVLGR